MSYISVNSKIKAMKGFLLSYDDYDSLSRLTSVEEIGVMLKNFQGYRKAMEDLEKTDMRREQIEQRLTLSLAEDFWRIYQFTSNYQLRRYLDAFYLKKELLIIKHLLALVFDERANGQYAWKQSAIEWRNFRIDVMKLYSSENVAEFIENLRGTQYYKPLVNIYSEGTTLFQLEMQLDLFYYINLWKAQNKFLNSEDKSIMNHIIGTEIDLRNIMWIYRFKRFYQMDRSQMYAYLIPINYHLRVSEIGRMLDEESIEDQDVLNDLLPRHYKSIFTEATTLEYDFSKAMYILLRKADRDHPDSIALLIFYMYAKECEINNVTSLIEGVRYGLNAGEILKYLQHV